MALKPKKTRICFTSHDRDSFYLLLQKKLGNPFTVSYADVFVSDSYAVKILRGPDPSFERYLVFVLSNQNNPYVPKIFKIIIGVGFKCIVMERLNHLCHDVTYRNGNRIYSKDEREYDKLFHALDPYQMNLPQRNKYARDVRFKKVRNFLHEGENVDRLDLHTENVMKRSCGQLVITDPMC